MKPILFNTNMVRAILNNCKTVMRRVVKPQPVERPGLKRCQDDVWRLEWWNVNEFHSIKVPICIGDILYVRETFTPCCMNEISRKGHSDFCYKASYTSPVYGCIDLEAPQICKWHPSIHMPREAARIFLRVTDVRVERLQDITPEQIDAEGCKEFGYSVETGELMPSSPCYFSIVWNNTIKKADRAFYSWEVNPWVWVIEFERISREEAVPHDH